MRCAGRATDTYVFLYYITHAHIIILVCALSHTGTNVFLNISKWCARAKKIPV